MAMLEPAFTASDTLRGNAKRLDVQGLRALAVVVVVAYHAGLGPFVNGFLGVDVFFVISGFVITGVIVRDRGAGFWHSMADFYGRRIRRIVPAATLVTLVTVAASFYYLGSFSSAGVIADARWASLFSLNFHMLQLGSDYFAAGMSPSLLLHYWSLGVEEQFYFVFPLIMFGARRLSRQVSRRALFIAVGAISLASLAYALRTVVDEPLVAFYSPFARAWEFALGALLVFVPRAADRLGDTWRRGVGWLSAIALVVANCIHIEQVENSILLRAVACGATALLILVGAQSRAGDASHVLGLRPIAFIGDLSYSFYLWHFVWLVLPSQYIFEPLSAQQRGLAVVAAFVCALASYYAIENPLRHSPRLARSFPMALLLLSICIALVWGSTAAFERFWLI
jgi:peptidoglycan/LPS O-acetylase OafA/YrhL